MPRLLSDRARPWLGSAVLHLAFVVLLAIAAFNWRGDPPPPPQLAIEGNVVRYEDLPPTVRAGKPLREPTPAAQPPAPRAPVETPTQPPPPESPAIDEAAREQAASLEREQQRLAAERRAEAQEAQKTAELERSREAAARQAREADAAAAKKRAADEADARRKADETRKAEALAAAQRQAEQEKSARDAKARAEREAELKRALATEEQGEAVARSGVVDEYRAMLIQTIERNWIKPPSARAGLECTLYVTQAPGGTVVDVKIGDCNGDQAVRESVANAVYRSSPLPAPRDPRAFERRLVMVFKPTE